MNTTLPDETPELAASIPPRLLEALRRYGTDHVPVGSFLTACLENRFVQAICEADPESLAGIRGVALFLYNAMPGGCWGSKDAVKNWLAMRKVAA